MCDRIEANLKNYENTYHECCEYLKRQNNEESFKELDLMNQWFTPFHGNVIHCLQKLKPSQTRKKTDEESTSSRSSIKSLQKLVEAKTKLRITERVIELKRQKSKLIMEENLNVSKYKQAQENLENELELLKCQGELELAESKVKFEMMENEGHVCDLGLPRINSVDKYREYVEKITLGPKQVKPDSRKKNKTGILDKLLSRLQTSNYQDKFLLQQSGTPHSRRLQRRSIQFLNL